MKQGSSRAKAVLPEDGSGDRDPQRERPRAGVRRLEVQIATEGGATKTSARLLARLKKGQTITMDGTTPLRTADGSA